MKGGIFILKTLFIENIAVIEKSQISFENGFQVITGETGAGKSIVIDSINFILGSRANRELIRTDCEDAMVSAEFTDLSDSVISAIKELGIEYEDGLVIQRNFSIDGKNTTRINGFPVTLSMLREIGKHLVNFHGQHENNNLLDSSYHLQYLDTFAKNQKERKSFAESYKKVRALQKQLRSMNLDEKEKKSRLEALNSTVLELQSANIKAPKNGEEDEKTVLTRLQTLLFNKEHLRDSLDKAWEQIAEENGAILKLYNASKALSAVASFDNRLLEMQKNLDRAYTDIEALKDDLRGFRYEVFSEGENQSLDDVALRLSLFEKLEKKYNTEFSKLPALLDDSKREIEVLSESESKIEELKETLRAEIVILKEKSAVLTQSRKTAGERLSEKIVKELQFLEMPSCKFECKITETEPTEKGFDAVEFVMSANEGEDLRPLSKVASGGELSRIMLGIKSVLAETEDVQTLIFDEIDSGVSGKSAQKIALKLAKIGKNKQVLAVTHLVQMASMGDGHILIVKRTVNKKTFTHAIPLTHVERVEEIARILGGVDVTDAMKNTAEEMLMLSQKLKEKLT